MGDHRKLEEARKDPLPDSLKGAWSGQYFDFRLLASRTERINFYFLKIPCLLCFVWYFGYGSPRKLIDMHLHNELNIEKMIDR